MTKQYVKLVGASTYTHRALGTIKQGDVVLVEDEDLFKALLKKGDRYEDGRLRSLFLAAEAPESEEEEFEPMSEEEILATDPNPSMQRGSESGDLSEGDFGRKVQAPTGTGPNGAQVDVDINSIDDAPENKGHDNLYHQESDQSGPDNAHIGDGDDDSDGVGTGANKEEGDDSEVKEGDNHDTTEGDSEAEAAAKPVTRARTTQRKSTSTK